MPKDRAALGDNLTPADNSKGMPPRTRIHIEDNPDIPPTGLFLGHNGRSFMIKSGVDVDVPDEVLEVLDAAVGKAPVLDPITKRVVDQRNKLRFPYRIVREPRSRAPAED